MRRGCDLRSKDEGLIGFFANTGPANTGPADTEQQAQRGALSCRRAIACPRHIGPCARSGRATENSSASRLARATRPHVHARAAQPKPPPPPATKPPNTAPPPSSVPEAATNSLRAWKGLNVEAVNFEGVDRLRFEPLPAELPLQAGCPLTSENVRQSLRRLYATGLYKGIEEAGIRSS